MNSNKKIGLLIPHLESGGAERVVSITSKLFEESGIDVFVFVYDDSNISYDYGGTLVNLNSSASNNKILKVLNRFSRIIKLSYYLRKYNIETTISFLYAANTVNYFANHKGKSILTCRGQRDYEKNGHKYSKMIKNSFRFIVQTDRMKLDFINDYNVDSSKLIVLPNPFNVDYIQKLSHEKLKQSELDFINFTETHTTAVTMGAFKQDKGYWHLIKAFILAKKEIPDLGLVFIGHRGELEKDIKEMIKKSGLQEDVFFVGFQKNPYNFLMRCDFYVCSSLNEGFPNAIVEAMAVGLPVISTDCKNGPKEILMQSEERNNNLPFFKSYGILIEPFKSGPPNYHVNQINREEEKLAEKIIELSINKELRATYSSLSYERSLVYDYDTFFKKLSKTLEKC
ncbi:hypothetical protein AUC31_14955 [Planococcus rifietoensis]|uniref:Glycosyl transferase family 1 domain-containing protein n=1 Tax=Planococcus rifietoensis TaxID=200991 RepID=A0A0U2J7R0_9BACL|nr:glycosyltransferase [Planococcus rifietoensis]ALS76418.1 hypothetical protein AUC31_14955 [Planococcus rifietoensis]